LRNRFAPLKTLPENLKHVATSLKFDSDGNLAGKISSLKEDVVYLDAAIRGQVMEGMPSNLQFQDFLIWQTS
jgi:hypothetical protein